MVPAVQSQGRVTPSFLMLSYLYRAGRSSLSPFEHALRADSAALSPTFGPQVPSKVHCMLFLRNYAVASSVVLGAPVGRTARLLSISTCEVPLLCRKITFR